MADGDRSSFRHLLLVGGLAAMTACTTARDSALSDEPFSSSSAKELSLEQLDLAFGLAIEQAPSVLPENATAVCLAIRPVGTTVEQDPPASLRDRISARLGRTAHPVSECGFETTPFVTASGEQAILYSVRVRERGADGSATILASATIGNLRGQTRGYRLVRKSGAWTAEPTGEWSVS